MSKLLTTTLAAAAILAIAMVPQKATAADGDDIARAIVGIAAAAIIIKAIDDRKDRKAAKASGRAGRLGSRQDHHFRDGRRVVPGRISPFHRSNRDVRRGFKRHALPSRCLRTVETSRGNRAAYSSRCLDHRFKFARRLPRSCETVIRTNRGFHPVYGRRCLARDGWNVSRR